MIQQPLTQVARCLQVECHASAEVKGITTDSRRVQHGMLFAALRGERTDGHDHAKSAADSGAAAILAEHSLDVEVPVLVVDDVLTALGDIARDWRSRLNPVVASMTGSNGKTTTKEMLTSILSRAARVLSTSGNFNNELGVPLTIFELDPDDEFAILEMGASKAGDIRYLANIAKPDVGAITNVGPAHLQGFGDEEGVARAKGEIYSTLSTEGFAVLNADEPWVDLWKSMNNAGTTITFGLQESADVSAVRVGAEWRLQTPVGDCALQLPLPGEHNIRNALTATAMAIALGIPLAQIKAGLEAMAPVPGRLNLLHSPQGWTILDDSYNANPASLLAAIKVLVDEPGEHWLVLGDMKELGEDELRCHADMGTAAEELGVDKVFTYGEISAATSEAFGEGAEHFSDQQLLIDRLQSELRAGVVCLVKGSRSMTMEKVVHAITGDDAREEVA